MKFKNFTRSFLGRFLAKSFVLVLILSNNVVYALNVKTIGGNSQAGLKTGLQAYSSMNAPRGLALDDDSNIYLADYENHILKIDDLGNLSVFAGSGEPGFKDATSTNANFNQPQSLVYFNSNIFVADTYNHCIRKINLKNRLVTTIAGSPGIPGYMDGTSQEAKFNMPSGITVDSAGNLYVSDTLNRRIRKIELDGKVSTIAGNGKNGFLDGPALGAEFRRPMGIVSNAQGDIFIVDRDNCRIRKLYQKNGIPVIETIIGTGMVGDKSGFAILAQLNMPEEISMDAEENLYISDTGNNKIKKFDFIKAEVVEIIGQKTPGYADGDATKSSFNGLTSLKVNKNGELIVADTKNNCVRKISFKDIKNDFQVTTIAGKNLAGTEDGALGVGALNKPNSIAKDSQGNIFIADTQNHLIRKLDKNGIMTKFAGSVSGFEDGLAPKAKFSFPEDIIIDSEDNIFVADAGNHRIRKITKNGMVSTFAGDGLQDNDDGSLLSASFNNPKALAFDKNHNILVADSGNNSIRQIIKQSSHVFTLAGNNRTGFIDGPALSASFNSPQDISINSFGDIFVADTNNHAIRKIFNNSGSWLVSTISGFLGAGKEDGAFNEASFNQPASLEFDAKNMLYVSDRENNKVRIMNFNTSQISSISGIGIAGFLDADRKNASFDHPNKIILDDGNLLVADSNNNRVRKISLEESTGETPSLGSLSTITENKKPLIKLVNDLEFDSQNFFKIQEGNPLELKVFVYDHEDEYKAVSKTQWISNIQGNLTTGLRFNTKTLSSGKHNITVIAQDSQGASKSIRFNLEVVPKTVTLSEQLGGCDKNGDGKINEFDELDYGAPLKTIVEIIPPKNKLDLKKDSLRAVGGQINEVREMVFTMDSQIIWEYEKHQGEMADNQSYREFLKQGSELELSRIPKGVTEIFARLDNMEARFKL